MEPKVSPEDRALARRMVREGIVLRRRGNALEVLVRHIAQARAGATLEQRAQRLAELLVRAKALEFPNPSPLLLAGLLSEPPAQDASFFTDWLTRSVPRLKEFPAAPLRYMIAGVFALREGAARRDRLDAVLRRLLERGAAFTPVIHGIELLREHGTGQAEHVIEVLERDELIELGEQASPDALVPLCAWALYGLDAGGRATALSDALLEHDAVEELFADDTQLAAALAEAAAYEPAPVVTSAVPRVGERRRASHAAGVARLMSALFARGGDAGGADESFEEEGGLVPDEDGEARGDPRRGPSSGSRDDALARILRAASSTLEARPVDVEPLDRSAPDDDPEDR